MDQAPATSLKKRSLSPQKKVMVGAGILLVTIPIIAYTVATNQTIKSSVLGTQVTTSPGKDGAPATKKEVTELLEKLKKLIQLPDDTEITVGTVKNTALLPAQPFYANAQNGDKIVLFLQSKKAILYRPSTNIIIEVSTINVPTATPRFVQQLPATPSAVTSPVTVIKPKINFKAIHPTQRITPTTTVQQ